MITDEKGRELHDKATKGGKLLPEEQQQLESWYAVQDNLEIKAIGLTDEENSAVGLQGHIESALSQLVKLTNNIKEIVAENEVLRKENANLLRQLAQRLGQQPA